MHKKLNFVVLGSGNGGRAFCGQIAHKGYPVVMHEPLEETPDYLRLKEKPEMFLKGDITAGGKLRGVTMDIKEAVGDADVIFIVVPSFAHSPIFQTMLPHLKEGQHVIIVPGNFGSFFLKKMISNSGVNLNISISETSSLPYACRISDYNTVMIHKKKFQMKNKPYITIPVFYILEKATLYIIRMGFSGNPRWNQCYRASACLFLFNMDRITGLEISDLTGLDAQKITGPQVCVNPHCKQSLIPWAVGQHLFN